VHSDFHLFGMTKNGLCGQHFPSDDTVIAAVKQWVTLAGAEHLLYKIVHFIAVVVSMEINRRHYFQSNLQNTK